MLETQPSNHWVIPVNKDAIVSIWMSMEEQSEHFVLQDIISELTQVKTQLILRCFASRSLNMVKTPFTQILNHPQGDIIIIPTNFLKITIGHKIAPDIINFELILGNIPSRLN